MISIIVPVYQTEKYIERCISSICNQTNRDFEVILVDDGTTDSSVIIAEKKLKSANVNYRIVCKKDSLGRVVNQGLASARNLGIKEAVGEWFMFIDSDDYIHPNTIRTIIGVIEEECDLIIFGYRNIGEAQISENFDEIEKSKRDYYRTGNSEIIKAFFDRKLKVVVPTVVIKREFLEKKKIEFPDGSRYSEDQIFLWKLFLNSQHAIIINKELYYYVHRKESIMTGSRFDTVIQGYRYDRNEYEKYRKDGEQRIRATSDCSISYDQIIARWILGICHGCSMILSYEEYKELLHIMQYRTEIIKLLPSRDIKVVLSVLLLFIATKPYYYIARKSLKYYCE